MPTLSPGRRAALFAGVPLILVSIAWNSLSLASLAGHTTQTESMVFDVSDAHLFLDANGRITLTPSTDGRVHVRTTLHYGLRVPEVKQRLDDKGLHIESNCRWYDGGNCSVDVDVSVPPTFEVDADASGGDLTATGLAGAVHLSSSGGSVRVDTMSGALELSSSGGSVRGVGLTSASLAAESSGGSVDIAFAAPPERVDLDSSGGGVTVRLPADVGYAIDAESSGGDTRIDNALRRDSGSSRTILARSSGGSVSVLPAG